MPATIKLKLNLTKLANEMDKASKDKMKEAVNELRNTVLTTLSGPRSGRTYRVPGTKKTYTASAPGQPPAQVTGDLRKSVKGSVEGSGMAVHGKVKASAKHALPLEFGHRQGGKHVAARPFMKPSFDKSLDAIRRILTRTWF